MAVLSLTEIPNLKNLIKPYGYIIHLHDVCGGQSFSLEQINDEPSSKVYEKIEEFFTTYGMTVSFFGKNKLDFTAR